ncbi:cupin domain-containing protein [Roseomonas aeriglobus]|nr:cupin domain-containing protein [Roseomonas aeriglobus]
MTAPRILRTDDLPRHDRGGGISTVPLVDRGTGSTGFLNGVTILAPGSAVPRHWHNCDESVLVISGDAVAEIDGIEHDLRAGDVSFIPAGLPHGFSNPSTLHEARIFWTYAAIDADRTDAATGLCRPIDAEHRGLGL